MQLAKHEVCRNQVGGYLCQLAFALAPERMGIR